MQMAFNLETPARARRTDPVTSHTAARSVKPRLIESLVLNHLRYGNDGNGLTTSEIAERSKIPRDSISPRMRPMEQRGLVVRTSEKRDGRIVWRLK
jgi:DNA-binding MarR family transcriptional regulator